MKLPTVLQARWAALAVRERRALLLAGAVVAAALGWSVLLGPALATLRGVPAQSQVLDTEIEHMQGLQARAQALQAQPALTAAVLEKLLQARAAVLGKDATLQLHGDQATLTLLRVPAQNLSQWLADARGEQLHPSELHLQREGDAADVRWSGTMVFRLPLAQGQ